MGALGSNCGLTTSSRKGIKGAPQDQGALQDQKGRASQDKGLGLGGRQDLLTDLQGTMAQGLCLTVSPTLPVEDSQVVEGGSHLWGWGQQVRD